LGKILNPNYRKSIIVLLIFSIFLYHLFYPVYAKAEVIILENHSSYISSEGTLYVVGEVENVGDKDIKYVQITATFYDEYNTAVDTETTYSGLTVIPPGSRSPFQLSIIDENQIQKIHNYSLVVSSYSGVTQSLPKTLMILSNSSYISVGGLLNIVGEVKNNGSGECTFTRVMATCYDDNGKVVCIDIGYTAPFDIAPGKTAPFNLIIYDETQSGKVTHYALQTQSDEAILIPEIHLVSIVLFIALFSTMIIIRQKDRNFSFFQIDLW
jgi:hypothetical protein